MDIREFLKDPKCFHFLKWVEIIHQESEAINLDSMYILEKNQESCEVIFIDSNGNKRKVSGLSITSIERDFAKLDLSNLNEQDKLKWQNLLGGLQGPPGIQGIPGPKGEDGNVSLLSFDVNDKMHLIMQAESSSTLDFSIDSSGHLIINN